jgi:2-keto-3-deoxy-L-rhamnonate aldolase RhmA
MTLSVRVCATVEAYSGLADRLAKVEGCEPVIVGFADIASVRHE